MARPLPAMTARPPRPSVRDPTLDHESFEAFHARTASDLWRYLLRMTADPATAEDVMQDAYVRFLNQPAHTEVAKSQKAYLFKIATNLVRDRWRRQKRRLRWLESQAELVAGSGTATPTADARLELAQVWRQLQPRDRSLLWLAYVEGFEHREIAEILGLRAGSVRVLLFRLRRRMARRLRPAKEHREDSP